MRLLPSLSLLIVLAVAGSSPCAAQKSGVDTSAFDRTVRPQDDFYTYVNGRWIQRVRIPDYLGAWSRGFELQVRLYEQVKAILERLSARRGTLTGDERRLADIFTSYMDTRSIEARGTTGLSGELRSIRAIRSPAGVVAAMARQVRLGIDNPLAVQVHPDDRNPSRYIADLNQSGLSLPNREYYSRTDSQALEIRARFRTHVRRVLELTGRPPRGDAGVEVLALETLLAQSQWSAVQNRDPGKTYNRFAPADLHSSAPGADWRRYIALTGLSTRVDSINVSQPSYLARLARLIDSVPPSTWSAYFEFHLADQLSAVLPARFADEQQTFAGAVYGAATQRPRWLRAVGFVEDHMPDAIGRLWVAEHVPAQAERQARQIVAHVAAAFEKRMAALDWMSATTKPEALAKLASLRIKLGSPPSWHDYSGLRTVPDDAVGNTLRLSAYEYERSMSRLSQPVDRDAWEMTPETVNGYYSARRNEVVLPAALMQPPYFSVDADDAANYGGFGWFVAHELSHAFDTRGAEYDARGNARQWWTREDRERFVARTTALAEQYSSYVVGGRTVDGRLTVGENIADNSGLAVAFDAYRRALDGRDAPVLDGLTGDQRFFASFATIWAMKTRPAGVAAGDTHSPNQVRVNGALRNQDAFHAAFDVRPGDAMYIAPDARVRIW